MTGTAISQRGGQPRSYYESIMNALHGGNANANSINLPNVNYSNPPRVYSDVTGIRDRGKEQEVDPNSVDLDSEEQFPSIAPASESPNAEPRYGGSGSKAYQRSREPKESRSGEATRRTGIHRSTSQSQSWEKRMGEERASTSKNSEWQKKREQDLAAKEAEQCRRRCKITWLREGEAPTKYFFARLKAKHAHEEMTALEREDGQILEGEEEILEEVQNFYQNLYRAEEETEETLEQRRNVVQRIDRRLTHDDNRILEEVPSEEFITTIVMEMPKEKSPGLDGVIIKILRIGWEFMKEDCFLMVQGFWDKKKLIGKDSRGVIKLIPKNERKHLLTNWRPITLLTTTYKIIAKIIAVRLKGMLPDIIDT
ncbi:hypothetical protein R1sor_024516 [Riccia sorocarpa]|uniref:Reverse transcriptase domain-containing protein n=1 Tax=Riccia sorocarpa TaxID=122646 RepID=A0ABD3GTX2_9MARC